VIVLFGLARDADQNGPSPQAISNTPLHRGQHVGRRTVQRRPIAAARADRIAGAPVFSMRLHDSGAINGWGAFGSSSARAAPGSCQTELAYSSNAFRIEDIDTRDDVRNHISPQGEMTVRT
jgi:hypothetical protein